MINRLEHIVDNLINEKKTFTIYLSQNSQKLIYQGKSTFFSEKKLNPKIFQVSKKIKKETEEFLEEENKFNDRRERRKINYYNYNLDIPAKLKRFYFIDLSSAYITSLKNNKIISINLFNEINTLKKKERLIALGVLAYEPYEVKYIDGIQVSFERVKNPYSPVFFTACSIISEIMSELIKLIDEKYIFYWVDGIFFNKFEDYYKIKLLLDKLNYVYRFGSCYNLISEKHNNHYKISFTQCDKGILLKKHYCIPYYFAEQEEKRVNYQLIQDGNFKELIKNYKKQIIKSNTNN